MSEPPQTVQELIERLSDVTQREFIRGWLDEPDRLMAAEESIAALSLWNFLGDLGFSQPDWVGVAHAAADYARRGLM